MKLKPEEQEAFLRSWAKSILGEDSENADAISVKSAPSAIEKRVHLWNDDEHHEAVMKNISTDGCAGLLSQANLKAVQDYCKYFGVAETPPDSISQCAQLVWEQLERRPDLLAYCFTASQMQNLDEIRRTPNGVFPVSPDHETVAKALALGLLDLSKEQGAGKPKKISGSANDSGSGTVTGKPYHVRVGRALQAGRTDLFQSHVPSGALWGHGV